MCDLTTINLKVKTVPSADNELYFQVPFHVWIYVKSIQMLVPFSLMHGMEYTHSIFFDRVPQLQACCFMNNLKVGPQSIDDAQVIHLADRWLDVHRSHSDVNDDEQGGTLTFARSSSQVTREHTCIMMRHSRDRWCVSVNPIDRELVWYKKLGFSFSLLIQKEKIEEKIWLDLRWFIQVAWPFYFQNR